MILQIPVSEEISTWNAIAIGFFTIVVLVLNHFIAWLKNKKNVAIINKVFDNFNEDNQDQNAIINRIKNIEYELKTNGGFSVKDVVSKMHGNVISIQDKLDKVISQARARTELALNQSLIAQFLCNDKGEITFANDAMSDLFGLSKTHLLKNKYLSVIDDQGVKEEIIRRLGFAISKQITFSMNDIPLRNPKDNQVTKVRLVVSPTLDDKDNFVWFLGKVTIENKQS